VQVNKEKKTKRKEKKFLKKRKHATRLKNLCNFLSAPKAANFISHPKDPRHAERMKETEVVGGERDGKRAPEGDSRGEKSAWPRIKKVIWSHFRQFFPAPPSLFRAFFHRHRWVDK